MAEGFRKLSIGLLTCTVSFVACGGPTVRESDDDPTYEDVLFEQLAGAPNRYHGNRVRVAGLCEIYFESTVLLLSENVGDDHRRDTAVWLQVGWPVNPEIAAETGKHVIIEARFDARSFGHMGCCSGTLTDIRRVSPATPDMEREQRRRAMRLGGN